MEKKNSDWILLSIFFILLLVLVIFSKKILFHDTVEYYNLIKDFAGFSIIKAHSTHSMVYSYLLAPFVKIFPSIITMKILNVVWLFFIALLLRNNGYKKAYILYIFSPMVWISAPQLTPVLPSAFFTLLAYLQFKKYEKTKAKKHFFLTSLSLGIGLALYTPMTIVALMFVISFMRNIKVKELITFSIIAGIAYIPRVLLDYKLTGIPFYSEIRFFGANLKNALGVGATGDAGIISGALMSSTIYFIFLVSPLLFMLFKTNYKKYKNELFFIITLTAFFMITGSYIKYLLIPGGIIFILLGKILNKKLIIAHIILSLIIIAIFVTPFFTTQEQYMSSDITQILGDYDYTEVVLYPSIAISLWEGSYFLPEEYIAYANNETYFSTLTLESNPTFYNDKILEIQGNLKIAQDDRVKDVDLWVTTPDRYPEGFSLDKCYDYLCVFTKIST
ncbi:MAG: hypothetical protein Q8Q35_01085 [Nanoarchaeota archaeon]|nr:hypothetical protein [Nanoarchaeota archaeon]